jgi:hypothetical protein
MSASIPGPLVNANLPALAHHRYALRGLREGFLYVQYEKHPRDPELIWHIYQITDEGRVSIINHEAMVADKEGKTREPEGTLVEEPVPTPCSRAIYIENPLLQQKVWLAFSDTLWSRETLARMESNGEDRDKRMHCFEPKQWIIDKAYDGAVAATSKNISKVIEYSKRSHYANLIGEYTGDISQPDGSFNDAHLAQCTTINQLDLDTGVFALLEQGVRGAALHQYGKSKAMEEALQKIPNANTIPPVMIALDDSAGIAYELNGFCAEPAGYLEQYQQERELQLHALRCITGAQDMMKKHAVRKLHIKGMGHQMTQEAFDHIGGLENNPAYHNAEVIPFTDEYGVEKLHVIEERYLTSWKHRHSSSQFHAWDDYKDDVNESGMNTFAAHYDRIKYETERLMNERTEDLVTWLKATPFVDSLVEYDKTNLNDGNNCVDTIGCAINGMTASVSGQALIDEWVSSLQVTDENLLWRAIGINHEETLAEVQTLLDKMAQHTGAQTVAAALFIVTQLENSLDNVAKASIKSMQLFALAQKSQARSNQRGGIEKLFTTVNQRLIKPFIAPGTDLATGLVMQATLMARSGIRWWGLKKHINDGLTANKAAYQQEKADIRAKFDNNDWKAYQKNSTIDRKKDKFNELDKLLKELDFDNSPATVREKNTLYNTWLSRLNTDRDELKQRHKTLLGDLDSRGKINDMAFVRFNTLVSILQGVAIWGLLNDLENEHDSERKKQLQLSLMLMGFSAAATLTDTVGIVGDMYKAPGSKALFSTGVKVLGAKLSVAAGVMATVMDFNQANKYLDRGEATLGYLYRVKGFLNAGSTFAGMATLLGIANPLLQKSGSALLRTVGKNAATFIAKRAFLIGCLWLGLAIVAAEITIAVLKENELEDWLERSAFGPVHKRTQHTNRSGIKKGDPIYPRYQTVQEQQHAFEQAILTVLSKV